MTIDSRCPPSAAMAWLNASTPGESSDSPGQFRKLTPWANASITSSGVIADFPRDDSPNRQTGLPNADAGRVRNECMGRSLCPKKQSFSELDLAAARVSSARPGDGVEPGRFFGARSTTIEGMELQPARADDRYGAGVFRAHHR